ncbi:carbon-nitrogen hydrolase family protein [Propionimicrobium sp. PCR01-08-3]|uniref:carbon-nitrogen hydrolase family protein n=1 Tax=Propionimicrobium sp. PCR01-08-3 TaxID=3052086 RepID=UPI00255C2A54|nr:carbon-nitrogen hydrolase family protein [Propionimicrobium sp. PCR01-08-3]WIY82968.1 carbon-nitrogen hydrolase family protein [Propionimicrobium sp. PCR01-08-3]
MSDRDQSSSPLRIALAQISASSDPDVNLTEVKARISEASTAGAKLVVFPEATMACFGTKLAPIAEPLDGRFASEIRAAAQQAELIAVVGMFTPADDGRVHNTLLITGPGVETHYDKVHLFDAFNGRESETVAPGGSVPVIDALGTRIGFSTCYDLRFADQFTELGRRGAKLIVVPASWADGPGKYEQWDVVTRARAMDAQALLAACDQAWVQPRGSAALGIGHSRVADPYGHLVDSLDADQGMLIVDLDMSKVDAARKQLPIL